MRAHWLTLMLLLSSQILFSQVKVKQIDFYYLPWNLTTQGNVSENEARNFNNGRTTTYSITKDTIITAFLNSLSIFSLNILEKNSTIDTRMVIDFVYDDNKIETICLNTQQLLKYNDNLYLKNHELLKLLKMYVPEAKCW